MCYNDFTIKIYLFKSKRFNDGRCTYKNTGSSHLNWSQKAQSSDRATREKDFFLTKRNDAIQRLWY